MFILLVYNDQAENTLFLPNSLCQDQTVKSVGIRDKVTVSCKISSFI